MKKLSKSKPLNLALAVGLVATNLVTVVPAYATDTAARSSILHLSNSRISVTSATFDKYKPKDVAVKLTLNGNELTGITNDSEELTVDTDYTVSEDGKTVTILKDYLAEQALGKTTLTFNFSAGLSRTLSITVKDTAPSAKISPSTSVFDKNKAKDVAVKVTLNGNELNGITNGSEELAADTDYTVSEDGKTVTILKDYLDQQPLGTAKLTFDFSAGKDSVLSILVKDTAPSSTISPSSAIFDDKNSKDIVVKVTPKNNNTLDGITNESEELTVDTDYTVSEDGKTVTILKEYLAQLENGTQKLTFDFSAGIDPVLKITVKNHVVDPQVAIVAAAEAAVQAYEDAPIVTLADITAAEALEVIAKAKVDLVTDEVKKADFEDRIAEKKAAVDAAKAEFTDVEKATAAVEALETAAKADLTVEANLTAAEAAVTAANAALEDVDAGAAKDALEARVAAAAKTVTDARAAFDLAAKVDTATKAVEALETAAKADLTVEANLTAAEAAVTAANAALEDVDAGAVKDALQARITVAAKTVADARVAFDATKTEAEAEAAAETAVKAYEDAPLTTLAEVTAAEALEVTANAKVELVTDAAKKAAFVARIAAKKTAVDAAKASLARPIVSSVSAINATTVEATLADVQVTAPAANKFVVKVGAEVVPVTGVLLKAGTTQTYTLTVNLDGKEGTVSVNDKAAATASDYKKPTVTGVEVIDSKQLRIKFSEKVNAISFPGGTSFKLMNRSNNAVATFTTATALAVGEGATSAVLTIGETSGFTGVLVDFDTTSAANVLELIDGNYRLYVNDVKDVAGNTIVANSLADFTATAADLVDKTAPEMVPATYNTASGQLVVNFTEAIKTGTDFDVTKFSINSDTEVIAQLSALDTASIAPNNKSVTIQLTATNIIAVRNAINAGKTVRVSAVAGAYKDASNNANAAASASITVSAPPVLTAAEYNEETDIITLTFDKAVVPSTITSTALTNTTLTFEGASAQNLSGATILSTTDPKVVRLYKTGLTEVNNDSTPAHTISLPANFIYTSSDTATQVGSAATSTTNNTLTYTEVTGAPILTGATLNNSTKKLVLTFDKNIASGNTAIDETKIDIVKNAGVTTGTATEALVYSILTDSDLATIAGNTVTITLADTTVGESVSGTPTTVADLVNAVNDGTALSVKLVAGAIKGANAVLSLATTSATTVTTQPYVAITATDATKPTASATVISSKVIKVVFSEKVNATDAINNANYSVYLTADSNAVLPISSVQLDSTGKIATVTLSTAQQSGATYTMKVSGVKDSAGNLMDAYTVTNLTGSAGFTDPKLVAGTSNQLAVTDADSSQNVSNNDYIILSFDSPVKLTDGSTNKVQVSTITDATALGLALTISGSQADVLEGASLSAVSGDNTKLKLTLVKSTVNNVGKGWNAVTLGNTTINIPTAGTNYIVSAIDNSPAQGITASQTIVAPISTGPKVVSAVYSDSNSTGEQDKGDKIVVTFDQNISVPDPTVTSNATLLDNDFGSTFAGATYKAAKTGDKEVTLTFDADPTSDIVIGTTTLDVASSNVNIVSSWGNAATANTPATAVKITTTDVTNPTLTAVSFNDTDNNGVDTGDKLILTFGEAIGIDTETTIDADQLSATDFALSGISLGSTGLSYAKSAFDNKQLIITLGSGATIAANATIDIRGFGTANITDAVGNKAMNLAAPLTIANVSVTDTTAPKITSVSLVANGSSVNATETSGITHPVTTPGTPPVTTPGTITLTVSGVTGNFTTGSATISEDVAITLDAPGATYDIPAPGIGVTTSINLVSLILSLVQDQGTTGISAANLQSRLNAATVTLTDKAGNASSYNLVIN